MDWRDRMVLRGREVRLDSRAVVIIVRLHGLVPAITGENEHDLF